MQFVVPKNDLHLVAYIEEHGGRVEYSQEQSGWIITTDRQEADWRRLHRNSSSFRVDVRLLALKKAMRH